MLQRGRLVPERGNNEALLCPSAREFAFSQILKRYPANCEGDVVSSWASCIKSIEITGMRPDTLDCTPAARQIQAVGGIGSQ